MKKNEYTLDAKGARLGRLATQAATMLMGKKDPGYARNLLAGHTVTITNVSRLDLSDRKRAQKEYFHHSGYPGGEKIETLGKLALRRGYPEIVRRAVYGMLPKNKLRERMMKHLIITD
jgi:large subunit ribosomal protein L13